MYMKRKGLPLSLWPRASNIASRPARALSWHTRRTSSKGRLFDLLGVIATVLTVGLRTIGLTARLSLSVKEIGERAERRRSGGIPDARICTRKLFFHVI